MEQKKKRTKISRRDFIKVSAAAGAGTIITGNLTKKNPIKEGTAYAANFYTKEHDDYPIETNEEFERFNNKNVVFMRAFRGESEKLLTELQNVSMKYSGAVPPSGEIGQTEIDYALFVASWSVNNFAVPFSEFGVSNIGMYAWEGELVSEDRKTNFSSPEEASKTIKRAAHFFDADLCGIAPYDERWTYTNYYDPRDGEEKKVDLPFKPKHTIVLAHEMDYEAFKCAHSYIDSAGAGTMYSSMAGRTFKLATFIRRLGYHAVPCGNDTAISMPLAIAAGLGELSRMGVVITPKYGPRVRFTKIFTDLELMPDKPITFGVEEFCKVCMKCADNCPSGAISHDKEPSYGQNNISNMKGVKKWRIDAEKCFKWWSDTLGDCGNCISVCPYNKVDEWHHNLAKLATVTPGVRTVARQLDELFGYGKLNNESAMKDFWEYKED